MLRNLLVFFGLVSLASPAAADPCGMVPPIRISDSGNTPAIQRTGAQRTYMMFKDGVETIVLRPGFTGKVDDFGMLIPFPSPPALRKIDDATFAHIEAAVDPPKMTVRIQEYLPRPSSVAKRGGGARTASMAEADEGPLRYDEVRVLNEEAVGMYQVAVLEAGSPKALSKWMDENGYRYPDGMDTTVQDYVAERWCFVAIKATVGQAPGVAPKPGMRGTNPKLPEGATFDGFVQGMGFRFKTESPVIPMRLSVFNPDTSGDGPRNVIYALTEQPVRVDDINTELVVRQVQGNELYAHLTQPLDITWIGGGPQDVAPTELASFDSERDPKAYNGVARALFATDLLAVQTGQLSLPFEEEEKELLRISEAFGLRGAEVDSLHAQAIDEARSEATATALSGVKEMSLTVVDGRLPVEVLAARNLKLSTWTMDAADNKERADPIRPVGPSRTVYKNR